MLKIPPIGYHLMRPRHEVYHAGERSVSTDCKKLETGYLDVVNRRTVPQDAACVPKLIEQWRDAHLEIDNGHIEHMLR